MRKGNSRKAAAGSTVGLSQDSIFVPVRKMDLVNCFIFAQVDRNAGALFSTHTLPTENTLCKISSLAKVLHYSPSPLKQGHPTNQGSYFGPNIVHIRKFSL